MKKQKGFLFFPIIWVTMVVGLVADALSTDPKPECVKTEVVSTVEQPCNEVSK